MRPYCVGLSGGIGSGKSTVADLFARLGAAVVDADRIAHRLTAAQGAAMPAIVAAFGNDCADAQGALDRASLRARIFADASARTRLEDILHPMIRVEAARQIELQRAPYVILVVPLLAENLLAYKDLVDRIVIVDCDESQQLDRVSRRPTLDREQVRAIMAAQSGRKTRLAIADDIIDNRGELEQLSAQVRALHAQYLRFAMRDK